MMLLIAALCLFHSTQSNERQLNSLNLSQIQCTWQVTDLNKSQLN